MRRKSCILHFDVSVPGYDTDSSCAVRSVREKTENKLVFQEKIKGALTLGIEPAKAAPYHFLTVGVNLEARGEAYYKTFLSSLIIV